jgi:excisionase family DNA binding protein
MSPESAALNSGLVPGSQPTTATYLLPAEVADLLRLSTKSIYRLAAQDATMPVLRLGGTLRFPRERLLLWLRSREQGRAQPRQLTNSQLFSVAGAGTKSASDKEIECG